MSTSRLLKKALNINSSKTTNLIPMDPNIFKEIIANY